MSWLRAHRRPAIFAALVLAQAVFVLAIVVREEGRLDGLEIVLESRPVDPRDPLRGDFVILSYVADDLSSVPAIPLRDGQGVYVEFEDRGRFWEPVFVSDFLIPRDDWRSGQVFVFARVEQTSPLRVTYPDLGAYFIPQGTGDPPEPPDVIVSVSDDGTVRIKRLEIDGVQWPNDTVPQDQAQPEVGPIATAEAARTPRPPPMPRMTPRPTD